MLHVDVVLLSFFFCPLDTTIQLLINHSFELGSRFDDYDGDELNQCLLDVVVYNDYK